VVAGDTLWGIARNILEQAGPPPAGADITSAWKMIYATNTDVVGPDPDLILPGQVLMIPGGVHG
jgi:nucleoid-associated protein YgaU